MTRRVSYRYAGQGRTDKRRDRRYALPRLSVSTGAGSFASHDWSLGGVRIDGIPAGCAVGDEVTVTFDGVRNGHYWAGTSMARVVDIDADAGQCAIEFVNLPDDAFRALEALMTGSRR